MFTTLIIVLINCSLFGQLEPIIGLEENKPRVWALTDAKVYLEPGISYENASIIIRDGLIETVGPSIKIPKDATIINMAGKIIYPGFIESWLKTPHFIDDSTNSGIHWNHKVFVRNKSQKVFNYTKNIKSKLHRLGFTAAHIVPDSGVYRGSSAISQLNLDATLLKDNIAQVIAYEVDGWGSEKFPNSLLGVVALIRQTMIDAQWYKTAVEKVEKYPNKNEPIETNIDLDILSQWLHRGDPFIFNTKHELDIFRSVDIANEFSFMPWFKGSGYEYRRVAHLKDMKPFIIVPLDFPVTPSYTENYEILNYTTAELKHWDKAPDNPAILFENNIPFSLTSDGLTEKEFRKNLNRSINRSLDAEYALASLTTVPAQYFGVSNKLGKIKEGFIANLTITDGDYFDSNADVISVWIGGTEYPISNHYQQMLRGSWSFNFSNKTYNLKIILKNNTLVGELSQGFSDFRLSKLQQNGSLITFQINWDSTSVVEKYSGYIIDNYIEGVSLKDGLKWSAEKNSGPENKFAQNKEFSPSNLEVFYPEGAYGRDRNSFGQQTVLVKNTTIWTCSKSGILFNTDILFRDGKIKKIGKDLSKPAAAILIDGSEKHITPGLIDCHSHSAAFAINEGTQSITSEVRIQDVINSDDITIYRELAGGLTIANILHGSANTIGGQNAVIKLRWGSLPGNLLYKNAASGIKFALGENVKQSNWGDDHTTRYPQTRMGVEQLLRDAFKRAEKYKFIWQDYNENKRQWKSKVPPRKNLELEALLEIMNGERDIHCHSYRQDEIVMLTRVAEDFGFTVGTFQHVLEGYKVAERIKEHGANASTFSDWWAYKYEVIDAIPFNATLMNEVGVNVSINSDSRELARRMNTEAAKAVKYGGMSEEEALRLVTINPAIQLGIEKWVGSLEIGKDADFVIWSDNPLSTKAICEQTWIDGINYFSLEKDSLLKDRDLKIRKTLIDKVLAQKINNTNKEWKHSEPKSVDHQHCEHKR